MRNYCVMFTESFCYKPSKREIIMRLKYHSRRSIMLYGRTHPVIPVMSFIPFPFRWKPAPPPPPKNFPSRLPSSRDCRIELLSQRLLNLDSLLFSFTIKHLHKGKRNKDKHPASCIVTITKYSSSFYFVNTYHHLSSLILITFVNLGKLHIRQ